MIKGLKCRVTFLRSHKLINTVSNSCSTGNIIKIIIKKRPLHLSIQPSCAAACAKTTFKQNRSTQLETRLKKKTL